MGCSSISIPAIATGSFGFPKGKCAEIMFKCVIDYVREMGDDAYLKNIRFINDDAVTVEKFVQEFGKNILIKDAYV